VEAEVGATVSHPTEAAAVNWRFADPVLAMLTTPGPEKESRTSELGSAFKVGFTVTVSDTGRAISGRPGDRIVTVSM
jgi:hypothetical protein